MTKHFCVARWCDGNQCFYVSDMTTPSRVARGLTPTLKYLFYNHFDWRKVQLPRECQLADAQPSGARRLATNVQSLQPIGRDKPKKKSDLKGKRLGNWLDRVLDGKKPETPAITPFLDVLKCTLARLHLQPYATQVPVGCCFLRLATKIDMICHDSHGRKVLIELKTGYDNNFWTPDGQMNPPLQHVSACFGNQALLQLMTTTILFLFHKSQADQYGGSYVIHLFHDANNDIQSEVVPLSVDLLPCSAIHDFIAALYDSRFENRRSRGRKRKRKVAKE